MLITYLSDLGKFTEVRIYFSDAIFSDAREDVV